VQGNPFYPEVLAEGQALHDANVLRDGSLYLWKCGGKEVQVEAACPGPYTKAWGYPETRTRANT